MTTFTLHQFPDVCRLCLHHKPAPEMVHLISTPSDYDVQLLDLLEEFCAPLSQQEFASFLPTAICEQCQQQFLAAMKFRQRTMIILKFQIAMAKMRCKKDSEPMRQLFGTNYQNLRTQFRELKLIGQEDELHWEDVAESTTERNVEVVENLENIMDKHSANEQDSNFFHIELLQDSDDNFSERTESHETVVVEYLNDDQTANSFDSKSESINSNQEQIDFEEVNCGDISEKNGHQLTTFTKESFEYQKVKLFKQDSEWNCDVADCAMVFEEKDELMQHKIDVHHYCSCSLCGVVLRNKYSLDVHIRRHMGETRFACEYCTATFYTAQEHKLHLGLVHVSSEMVKCDICGLEFRNSTCLKRHLKSHSEVRNYKCPYCDKAFKTNMHLHRHKETIHLKVRFRCSHCDISYGRKDKLRMHVERVHNIQMYFLCDICLKSFSTEQQRMEHINHHENPKPLECSTCLVAFLTSEEFDKHLCISYRDSYVCCNRDFKFHTFFNKHMFLAHGEKTNARVRPAANKLIAKMRAERKQEERCAKCGKTFDTRKQKNAHKLECREKQ